ncbi:MAG: DUF1822 family protein [Hydrococcus sp. SU_1_0]|nr:DUF1822 family protein [Hydrococcus sp. SU_1_0]
MTEPSKETVTNPLKKAWLITNWLKNGVPEIAKVLGGWETVPYSFAGAIAMGAKRDEQESYPFIRKELKIAGQTYEFRVELAPEDGENCYRFELRNMAIGGKIPGGFKLRLLTEEMEDFEGHEEIATEARDSLRIVLQLNSGDGIIYLIEPFPD